MLAKAFGLEGYSVSDKVGFKSALEAALKSDKSCVIEVKIERFENVIPMVAPGAAIYNMVLE